MTQLFRKPTLAAMTFAFVALGASFGGQSFAQEDSVSHDASMDSSPSLTEAPQDATDSLQPDSGEAAPVEAALTPDSSDSSLFSLASATADSLAADSGLGALDSQAAASDTAFDSATVVRDSRASPFNTVQTTEFVPKDAPPSFARRLKSFISASGLAGLARASARFLKRHGLRLFLLVASLVVIWYAIARLLGKRERQRFLTTTRLSLMDKEVQRACRHIERNYATPDLSVESLCRELVTGEAFLNALFERELGMTIDHFITQVRVNRVKILLNTSRDVADEELAQETGFDSIKRMREAFTRLSGIDLDAFRAKATRQLGDAE